MTPDHAPTDTACDIFCAVIDNFASRWLELGKLAGVVPDADLYREFDENLRQLGVMTLTKALDLARSRSLDLVEIARTARPGCWLGLRRRPRFLSEDIV